MYYNNNIQLKYWVKCFVLFVLILFAFTPIQGQDCSKAVRKCKNPDSEFKISPRSRGVKMRRGKKSRIVFTAYGGRTYYFSTYAKSKVGKLQFRIIDVQSNKIVYDNSSDALREDMTLKVDASQKLYIDLLAPNWSSDEVIECVAFKIAYKVDSNNN